jgi:hypothetical protein
MTQPDANDHRPVSSTCESWDGPEHKQPKRLPAVGAACPSTIQGICVVERRVDRFQAGVIAMIRVCLWLYPTKPLDYRLQRAGRDFKRKCM